MRRTGRWMQLACLIVLPAMGQSANPNWQVYTNARFSFAVCYPPDVLVAKGESDNGDGQTFSLQRQDDGRVLVFGRWADATPSGRRPSMAAEYTHALRESRSDGFRPGYSVLKPGFFVVSATGGGRIHYQKTMRAGDRDITLIFDYPEVAKPTMDSIVSKMASCLTAIKQ